MAKRKDLHQILVALLDEIVVPEETVAASKRVYFQPPESIKLHYPCVVYKRAKMEAKYANNVKYSKRNRYQVTTMDLDPDGLLHETVFELPLCAHAQKLVVGGLNHDVFDLYY